MDAGCEAVVPLLGGLAAEVALRLMPSCHRLALYDETGLLIVGRAIIGIGHMQAHRGSLGVGRVAVGELAAAALAEELPHRRVVEFHDGETFVPLHKLVSVASGRHIDGHRRAFMAQIVAYGTPADSHSIALAAVAYAEYEVFGEKSEAVVREVLLHVEGL